MRYRFFSFDANISSLHEMRLEQIGFYLSQFDRLLKEGGAFYFKQWKRGAVPFEDVVIHQRDYPIPRNWTCDLSREAPIQTNFFEERYKKSWKSTGWLGRQKYEGSACAGPIAAIVFVQS
jgi:hypothetical protein